MAFNRVYGREIREWLAMSLISAFVVMACWAAFVAVFGTSGCTTLRQAQTLEQMSESELEAFAQRTAFQVSILVEAALAEGDLEKEQVSKLAEAFQGLGVGSTAGVAGGLAEAVQVEGYGQAALALAVIELDAQLQALGAFSAGGVMGPQAQRVMVVIAERLQEISTRE